MHWRPRASKSAARSSGPRTRSRGASAATSSSTSHCSTAHVAGQKDPWYGDKSQSTLWQENKPAANRLHPTMKPVELVERALLNSSKAGDIVADLFGGSGSTLIGCERRGRKARLMEIDPKYADCIVRRYQEYTGKQAVLDGDGRTFDEIAGERLKEPGMNRALPPGDCGDRIVVAGRTSGHRGPLYGACGLVDGTEAIACRADKEKPPRRHPGGGTKRDPCGIRL